MLCTTFNIDYHRAYGDLDIYFDGVLLGNVSSACVLLLAMRRDRRTALLAAYFLLNATIVHPVLASSRK